MIAFRRVLRRGLEGLALAMALLAAIGMAAIVTIIVTSVTMRKLFNAPLHFTEEVVGLLLSVSLLLALPMVTLKGGHVRVSILANHLRGWQRRVLSGLAACVGIGLCAWVAIEAVPWLEFAVRLNLKTETSRILLYPWMAMLPLSLLLTAIVFVARLSGLIAEAEPAAGRDG